MYKGIISTLFFFLPAQVFQSPWACDAKHEEQFAALMESLFHLEMDTTTTILMTLVVLFSPGNGDGVNRTMFQEAEGKIKEEGEGKIKEEGEGEGETSSDPTESVSDRDRCVRTQQFFTQMLFRYLSSAVGRPNATRLMPKYLQLASHLEEMAKIMITKRLML